MKKIAVLLLALAVVAGFSLAIVTVLKPEKSPAPSATGEAGPPGLERFYGQDLTWEKCGRHTCASVLVPVDYADPDGETFTIRIRRVAATKATSQVLFVNPGGPGGSAMDFASTVAGSVSTDMTAAWDIVGVDPRGVGESTPLQCLSDPDFDDFIAVDPTPDTQAEQDASVAALRSMGEACAAHSGALASHVSTEEAARDQDVVRALLGQEKLHWYGASYGTQLGATYAHLFPEKVGRMVLDGAVDVSLDAVDSSLGQAEGFHRALVAYLEDCIAQGDCPTGDTVEEGLDTIKDLLARLDAEPMKVSGGRLLTESHGSFGIAIALYAQEAWPVLTMALEQVLDGDPQMLMYLADTYFERQPDGSFASNSGQVILAVNCLDSPGGLTMSEVPTVMNRFTAVSPVFGPFLAWGSAGCSAWPLTSTTPQGEVSAAGAPPIVVVGTTRDPATPYEWARSLADQLESGVLLSREGDGHTAYLMGNACIEDAIDAFYLEGVVPRDGTMCAER